MTIMHSAHAEMLRIENVSKSFTLHLRGGVNLSVVSSLSLHVNAGECVALNGPSGTGKSSILKMIFGSYLTSSGAVLVRSGAEFVDIAKAGPLEVLALRQSGLLQNMRQAQQLRDQLRQ
jgi:alpha-D-ribose 1-methylphosphonate 5-triphosphate synthase subunit PhnL